VPGSDAAEAIAWEAAERNGLPRGSVVADAVPTGAPSVQGDGKEEQLVIASPVEPLEAALEVLIEAGFDPVVVEPRFVAVARALSRRTRREADQSKVRAVLHVEQQGSLIMVLRGDRIAFCREIPIGGETLDHAVASRLGVAIQSARDLRLQRLASARGAATAVDPVADEAASAATRATLDALAGEMALCLRYYGVTFRGGQPGRVILSGPHGGEPRLASIIGEAARVEVSPCASELPAAATGSLGGAVGDSDFAPWIAAYGLACRSCERRSEHEHGAGHERKAA
jgi:Tfp pilus assembly PilM family ATPase